MIGSGGASTSAAQRVAGAALAVVICLFMQPRPAAGALLALAVDDEYATAYGTVLEVDEPGLLGNDLHVIGSTDLQISEGPDHGEVDLKGHDGAFEYRPDDGFSGTDTFEYQLTTLLVGTTTATVTIEVGPPPTPTPKPTPAPTPTSTPRQTPTPRPPLPVPLPTIDLLPTPTPLVGPTPKAGPNATPSPPRSPGPASSPGMTPAPTESAVAIVAPRASGSGPPHASDGPGRAISHVPYAPARDGDGLATTVAIDTGIAISPTFLVPTLAFTVPGLLLMLAIIAQGAGALAWIPFVRRSLGDDERERRRRRARASARAGRDRLVS